MPATRCGRPVVFLPTNPDTIYAEPPHEIPTLGLATAICEGRGWSHANNAAAKTCTEVRRQTGIL
ncbi:hypothetical protein QL093DRAFT_2169109 [Fusarium oxysporum]|nr:hypothetical protein QL093DRAFT_2169109 [Fusarium oxysporum]